MTIVLLLPNSTELQILFNHKANDMAILYQSQEFIRRNSAWARLCAKAQRLGLNPLRETTSERVSPRCASLLLLHHL